MHQWRSRSTDTRLCSLCHDSVRKPTQLPCQHIYCEQCMSREFAKRQGYRGAHDTLSTQMCPYCRDFFSSDRNKTGELTPYHSDTYGDKPYGVSKPMDRKSEGCQPCKESGQYTPAVFWCTVCSEYFCSLCSKYHRSMKMSKNHPMKLAKDVKVAQTPRSRPQTAVDTNKCDPCRQRKKTKTAKFFCQRCSERFCNDCAQCHRGMKMSKTHRLMEISERPKPDIYGSGQKCSIHYGEGLNLYCKRCQISCCSICAITNHTKCGEAAAKIDMSGSLGRKAKPLERSVSMVGYGSKSDEYVFNKQTRFDSSVPVNGLLDAYSSSSQALPSSMKKDKNPYVNPKPVAKIRMENRKSRINFSSATTGDWVISMAVQLNGNILLIELYQSELKQINPTGNLLATCKFYADPWAVTLVDDKMAAVTFSDRNQIQFVNIKPGSLVAGKKITTQHKCLGICCANRYLITTCWEGCVHVIALNGAEMYCINKDSKGVRLFTNPEYITANYPENEIYVSDFKRNTVTALQLNGYKIDSRPKFIFSDKDLQGPKGVSVDAEGILYICGMTSRNILRVSPDGRKIQTFSRREDTDYYEAMYVFPAADKMLVSAYEDNTIIMFRCSPH